MEEDRLAEKDDNLFLDCALLACAVCYQKYREHSLTEAEIFKVSQLTNSEVLASFFAAGLGNLLSSYTWKQIKEWISMAYNEIDKDALSDEELQTLGILSQMLPRLFWKQDFRYFYNTISNLCPAEQITMVKVICPNECEKIGESPKDALEGAVAWGIIGD